MSKKGSVLRRFVRSRIEAIKHFLYFSTIFISLVFCTSCFDYFVNTPGISPNGTKIDVTINGEGYFLVRDERGTELFTRNPSFYFDDQGLLVDGRRFLNLPPVSRPGGASSTSISPNGAVVHTIPGVNYEYFGGTITLYRFDPPSQLKGLNGGYFIRARIDGKMISDAPGQQGLGTIEVSGL